MKTVHLFDQHHEGKNTSHYLMMADGEIPRIVHRSEETGEWVDGYRYPPGEVQIKFVRRKLMSMKIEVYSGKEK